MDVGLTGCDLCNRSRGQVRGHIQVKLLCDSVFAHSVTTGVCVLGQSLHTHTVGSLCLTARRMEATDAHITFTHKTVCVDLRQTCVCAWGSREGEEELAGRQEEGEERDKVREEDCGHEWILREEIIWAIRIISSNIRLKHHQSCHSTFSVMILGGI